VTYFSLQTTETILHYFSDEVIYDLDHTQDAVGTTIVVLENGQEEEIPVFEIGYVLKQ
jgi:hypothetical protein